ncbi:dTDP-4-dehydrorhamnose reductase [Geomicrobium sediminis]|uniref:dTDP-4-dehydrorhamnose reductase n=1 Tax=Geomicrobium sediminis TaxID=1347788 RepID=A0ABS2PIX5_9BACL|nr:dTDP-4-dehydrorhamnose reductase [Geomicrobium sediminis]
MSIHKVLVTGAGGQLGNALVKQLLIAGYNVVPMDRNRCDVRMLEEVYQIFTKENPDVVIHAAAYTNVDAAEENMDDAYAVNTYGTRNVAISAKDVGARLVYVSTDFVFEGNQTKPYSEFDQTNPLTVYGQSKLAGESMIARFHPRSYTVRTSWLYGEDGHHFVSKIIQRAHEVNELQVVSDEIGTPTYTYDLASFIQQLMNTKAYGTYHFSNQGSCSRYEWAKEIIQYTKIDVPVRPIQRNELHMNGVPRPYYSVLAHQALRLNGFPKPRPWQEALEEYINRQHSSNS